MPNPTLSVPKSRTANIRVPKMNATNAKLWAHYCDMRDEVIEIHKDAVAHSGKSPRGVYLFATHPRETFRRFNTPPPFIFPHSLTRWLKTAIRRCERLIANPNGYEDGSWRREKKEVDNPTSEKQAIT